MMAAGITLLVGFILGRRPPRNECPAVPIGRVTLRLLPQVWIWNLGISFMALLSFNAMMERKARCKCSLSLGNEIWMYASLVILCISLVCIIRFVLVRFRFDRHRLYRITPFGDEKIYDFESIATADLRNDRLHLCMQDGSKVTLSLSGRSEVERFGGVLNSYVLRYAPPPVAPLQNAELIEGLVGHRVSVDFYSLQENWLPQLRGRTSGIFERADLSSFVIRAQDGQKLTCPANLRGVKLITPTQTTATGESTPAEFSMYIFIQSETALPSESSSTAL